MELYQAEYMVGGTGTVAIESDSDLTCELGSFSHAKRFSDMEQSSEKTSELCSQVDCRSGQDGVKGQDERQRTAPLTPPRPLKENPCQKSLDWSRRCHTRKLRAPPQNFSEFVVPSNFGYIYGTLTQFIPER